MNHDFQGVLSYRTERIHECYTVGDVIYKPYVVEWRTTVVEVLIRDNNRVTTPSCESQI